MEQLGVGRTRVRKAPFALEETGLVATTSGEWARVIRRAPGGVLVEPLAGAAATAAPPAGRTRAKGARTVFEAAVARLAALCATDVNTARLEAPLESNRQAIADGRTCVRSDVAVRRALSRLTFNSALPALHEAIVAWLTEQRRGSTTIPDSREAVFRWHERIP